MKEHSIRVLAFGMIAGQLQTGELRLQNIHDTEELQEVLKKDFPQLQHMKFSISVNRQIVHGKLSLDAGAEVALLPPFSGG